MQVEGRNSMQKQWLNTLRVAVAPSRANIFFRGVTSRCLGAN